MKRKISEEAQYERMRNLANVNKTAVKESQNRTLGTLIDYKRAADGVAYGIIKENHHYYVKKGGMKQDPNVADFAYIGGLANITNFQYKSLSEADKQRNMLFCTINEAGSTKLNKTGGKVTGKKRLNEDKAGEEIEASAEMAAGLDAATADAEVPAEPEMGLGDTPAPEGSEEMPPTETTPAPESGEELPPAESDEVPAEPTPEGEPEDELAPENGEEGAPAPEGEEGNITTKEIEKTLGKLTNKLRQTELTDSQVKSYVNSFLAAFKDKFPDVEVEDRKAMADKITKVVPDEDIEGLGQNVEKTAPEGGEVEEQSCSECGGFAQYAESRGYTAESIQECGEEEMSNLVSGYANAHNDGQNDGDFKAVALFITPEIIEKLKGDYGHDEYTEKLTPFANSMNEVSAEDKVAQINELFGGLGQLGKKAVQGIGSGIKSAGQAIGGAAQKVNQAVGQAATNVKQTYYAGEKNSALKKLETIAADLGKQIAAVNANATKAGQEPINVNSILTTIKNQVGSVGTANLGKFKTAEGVVDPAGIEVQPLEEIKVPEKAGQKLSTNAPVKELKEEEEPETEDNGGEDIGFAPEAQSLGGGVVKPEGAPTTGLDISISPDKTVNIAMNESEVRVRKYIRNKLEELAGVRKSSLNEDKKSEKLKKLDKIIETQFKLYESVMLKKKGEVNEVFGFSTKEKFAKLNPEDSVEIEKLLLNTFDILKNPQYANALLKARRMTSTPEKYEILKQYVQNDGGTLRTSGGKLVYAPKAIQNKVTPAGGGHVFGAGV